MDILKALSMEYVPGFFWIFQMASSMELVPVFYACPDGNDHGIIACIKWISCWHYPWNRCLYSLGILWAITMEWMPVCYGYAYGISHWLCACIYWKSRWHYPWNSCLYFMDILRAFTMEWLPVIYGCPDDIILKYMPVLYGYPKDIIHGINACIWWTFIWHYPLNYRLY